jgi:hypothetical protein
MDVLVHANVLVGAQTFSFGQDLFRYPNLANVMQQGCQLNVEQIVTIDLQPAAHLLCE